MKRHSKIKINNLAVASMLLVTALFSLACPNNEEPIEPPEPVILIPIFAGTSVEAEFETDGQWQASGFVARVGDLLKFEPEGNARYLAHQALQLHIGHTPQQLVSSNGGPQRITLPGEIFFRNMIEHTGPYPEKTIRIKISNVAKKD